MKKQDLVQWVNLALQRTLIADNIVVEFRAINIEPLNKKTMIEKMDASEILKQSQVP